MQIPNLRKSVISGVSWTFVNQLVLQLITLVVGIILSRIISPKEFGLLAMITIFTNFGRIFVDMGFSSALIQRKNVTQSNLSTVFWFNVFSGTLLSITFYLLSDVIADFYSIPILSSITKVISVSILIASFTSIQSVQWTKELNFKKQALLTWTATIIASVVSIIMAYKGFGVWSLVAQAMLASLLTSALYWFTSSWRPSFVFNIADLRSMFKFGGSIAGDTIFNYWTRNMDNLMVGKILGDGPLGIYNRAYTLMLLPLTNITGTITRVMFPAFSGIQDDLPRIKRIYLKISRAIAFFSFPMMFGLGAVSEPFILFTYGYKWAGVIPILRILSIMGAIQSVISLNGILYNSQGKAHLALRATIFFNIILIIAFYIGIHYWGLLGITWAYFIVSVLSGVPIMYFAIRLIHTSLLDQAKNLYKIFVASFTMALIVYLVSRTAVVQNLTYFIQLSILVVIGFCIYGLLILLFKEKIYLELIGKYVIKTSQSIKRKASFYHIKERS